MIVGIQNTTTCSPSPSIRRTPSPLVRLLFIWLHLAARFSRRRNAACVRSRFLAHAASKRAQCTILSRKVWMFCWLRVLFAFSVCVRVCVPHQYPWYFPQLNWRVVRNQRSFRAIQRIPCPVFRVIHTHTHMTIQQTRPKYPAYDVRYNNCVWASVFVCEQVCWMDAMHTHGYTLLRVCLTWIGVSGQTPRRCVECIAHAPASFTTTIISTNYRERAVFVCA